MDYFFSEDVVTELPDTNESDPFNATFMNEVDSEVNLYVLPTVYFLMCVIGLGINALTLYVALIYVKLNKATNVYIFNVVIGDILVMLGLLFTASQQVMLYWPFGPFLCKVVMMVDFINPLASIFFILLMSSHHFVSSRYPEKTSASQQLTVVKLLAAGAWLVATVFVLPVIIFANVNEFDQCTIVWPEPGINWDATYTICMFTLGFCFPVTVTGVILLLLIVKAKTGNASVDPNTDQGVEGKKLALGLFLIFILCWLPLNVQSMVDVTGNLPIDLVKVYDFFVILTYAKSCINPLLYAFLCEDFKQGFRNIFCC